MNPMAASGRKAVGARRAAAAAILLTAVLLPAGMVSAQQPGQPGTAPPVPGARIVAEPAPEAAQPDQVPAPDPIPSDSPLLESLPPGTAPGTEAPVAVPDFGRQGEPEAPRRSFDDKRIAVLQGLDKITARTSTFEIPVGETGRFKLMDVTVRACRKAPPIEPPEAAAFLELEEKRPDEAPQKLFSGWMFASSPALSALQHPVYDVWVIDCRNEPTKAASSDAQ